MTNWYTPEPDQHVRDHYDHLGWVEAENALREQAEVWAAHVAWFMSDQPAA